MTVGLIDFFVLEASDYVDRLQRLLGTADAAGPDATSLLKLARGLRGSASMAQLAAFAEAAGTVEHAGRLLVDGRITWTPQVREVLHEAVSELSALVPLARQWSDQHTARARSASEGLARRLDAMDAAASAGAPDAAPANPAVSAFLGASAPAAAAPAPPPEMPAPQPPMPVAMRTSGSVRPASPTPSGLPMSDASMPIVSIASLAPDGVADALVHRAPTPPSIMTSRFITDVTPLVGSLRARLAPLRQGAMQEVGADMVASFRPVLVSLRDTAASYQYEDVRAFCDAVLGAASPLGAGAAGALDAALNLLVQPETAPHMRAQRMAELRRVVMGATPLATATVTSGTPASAPPALRPTTTNVRPITPTAPVAATAPARTTPTSSPSGAALSSMLNTSLNGMRALETTPLDLVVVTENAATVAAADIVPVEDLLYRGPRALSRARHLVTQLRANGRTPNPALLEELFDLVELAGATH